MSQLWATEPVILEKEYVALPTQVYWPVPAGPLAQSPVSKSSLVKGTVLQTNFALVPSSKASMFPPRMALRVPPYCGFCVLGVEVGGVVLVGGAVVVPVAWVVVVADGVPAHDASTRAAKAIRLKTT